eukprot:scaffold72168_cov55-Phaeocystis_antarctica.AAC.2
MAKSTYTRNRNTWETGTCKRPEQEAQRLRPRGSGPGRRRGQEPLLMELLSAASTALISTASASSAT